jgi:hypothetical protein
MAYDNAAATFEPLCFIKVTIAPNYLDYFIEQRRDFHSVHGSAVSETNRRTSRGVHATRNEALPSAPTGHPPIVDCQIPREFVGS